MLRARPPLMPDEPRDIVVIGASAGGVPPLQRVVAGLPADLPAAVFVVMHQPSWHKSELPRVLSHKSSLPVLHAEPDQAFQRGRIYVAPPDYHLLVEHERIRLWRGPKENRHRPAVNALFRSAAVAHQRRVIGAILSGALDDGSTGLWWVKHFGGVAIVQDPSDATFAEMPRNAMEHVAVDHVVGASAMGPLLASLTNGDISRHDTRLVEERVPWKTKKS